MKRVLLLFISIFFITCAPKAQAYQTVLVDFPSKQGWHAVYYKTLGTETILQYVPQGQSAKNWKKSIIFHSYNDDYLLDETPKFLDKTTTQMLIKNPTQNYSYLKYTPADSIATRCVEKTKTMPAQCEIFRATNTHTGIVSIHYVNKNRHDFINTYQNWLKIVKDVRIYYSYYRTNLIMDKATRFEI